MRLYPSRVRQTIIFIFNAALVVGIFLGTMWEIFFKQEWNFLQWLLISVFIVISIISYIFILKSFYYTIQNKFFTVRKFNKEFTYNFNDIIYIDEEYSSKKSSIMLVLKEGIIRYFVHDKNRKLYAALLKNCKNLQTREEVIERFPNLSKELK